MPTSSAASRRSPPRRVRREPEPEPQITAGSLVYQVLERALKPGEVSLDDLERAFRATPGPAPESGRRAGRRDARDIRARAGRRRAAVEGADDPRQRRHARAPHDHGLGAGADAQPAPRDRPAPGRRRLQGAAAAPLARHRRAAGRRHEDAHAADRHRLAEAAAGRARPLGGAWRRRSSSSCRAPRPSSTARCSS